MILRGSVFALMLALASVTQSPARAESPPCECTATVSDRTVPDELSCLEIAPPSSAWMPGDGDLDACYGRTLIVVVKNSCSFDVVIADVPELNSANVADTTIAAGDTQSWQQAFEPPLSYDATTAVSLSWTVEAEGSSHTAELAFTGKCTKTTRTSVEGCALSSSEPSPWFATAALFIWLLYRRRHKPHVA